MPFNHGEFWAAIWVFTSSPPPSHRYAYTLANPLRLSSRPQQDKFVREEFGTCHRVFCEQQPMLPVGQADVINQHRVSLYCPRCKEIYAPRSSRHLSEYCAHCLPSSDYPHRAEATPFVSADIDGAYFGTTFPHLFLMTYPSNAPAAPLQAYVPRVFGFKIHNPDHVGKKSKLVSASTVPRDTVNGVRQPAANELRPGGPRPVPLTQLLPTDVSGRIIGRDGRLMSPDDDFFDEEDAPDHGRAAPPKTVAGNVRRDRVGRFDEELDETFEGGDGADPGTRVDRGDSAIGVVTGTAKLSIS